MFLELLKGGQDLQDPKVNIQVKKSSCYYHFSIKFTLSKDSLTSVNFNNGE